MHPSNPVKNVRRGLNGDYSDVCLALFFTFSKWLILIILFLISTKVEFQIQMESPKDIKEEIVIV